VTEIARVFVALTLIALPACGTPNPTRTIDPVVACELSHNISLGTFAVEDALQATESGRASRAAAFAIAAKTLSDGMDDPLRELLAGGMSERDVVRLESAMNNLLQMSVFFESKPRAGNPDLGNVRHALSELDDLRVGLPALLRRYGVECD
jgi:hypothetical protein